MDEAVRSRKTTKFGSIKYVYPKALMDEMRHALEAQVRERLGGARILYWT
jgi:spore photoproduct lyase